MQLELAFMENVRRKFYLEKYVSLIVRIHRQLKLTSWSLRSVALEIEKAKKRFTHNVNWRASK